MQTESPVRERLKEHMKHFTRRKRLRRITQKESQKFRYMVQVINALYEGPSFPTELVGRTRLSPKSIVGTLKILEERGIVSLKRKGHKKIYELNISEAKRYVLNGLARSLKKRNPQTWKVLIKAYRSLLEGQEKQNPKQTRFLIPKQSIGLERGDQFIQLDRLIPYVLSPTFKTTFKKYEKEYEQLFRFLPSVSVWEMPDLFIRYRNGQLCVFCLEAGLNYKNIVEDRGSGEKICGTCGCVIE